MNDTSMIHRMRRVGIELVAIDLPPAPFTNVIDEESAATRPLVLAGADESRWLTQPLRVANATGYATRLRNRKTSAAQVVGVLDRNNLDAITYPTTPFAPALRGERQPSANCQISATTGLPALALGHGLDAAGVPVPGVDLLGRAFDEATLLRIGLRITE